MPPIDPTTPADNAELAGFPANERTNRSTTKTLIELEHDGTTGKHKLKIVADAAARDAYAPTPVAGMIVFRQDTDQLEIYDGSAWFPAVPAIATPLMGYGLVIGQYEWETASKVRLTLQNGSAIRVEIDGVIVSNSSALSFDIASHLDTGVEAASTFYYCYVENVAGVLTPHISATGPSLPGSAKPGYHPTHATWRYLGSVRNNSSSDFTQFQADQYAPGRFEYVLTQPVGNVVPGESTVEHSSVQDADVSALLPTNARQALIHAQASIEGLRFHLFDGHRIAEAITSTSPGPYTPFDVTVRDATGAPNMLASLRAWVPLSATRHIGYARTRHILGTVGQYDAGTHKFTVYGWRDA